MKVNTVQSPSFQGIPISEYSVVGSKAKYKLYDITQKDCEFLSDLSKKINLEKLMPNMKEGDYFLWNGILHNALESSDLRYKKIFIETINNVPCGVMNYFDSSRMFHVNYVATFPDKSEHRVPCAGQILFNELFRRFINSDAQKIELTASRNAPFSPISTYLKLGFKMFGGNEYSEIMRIREENILETLEKQRKFLTYEPLNYPKDVDLGKIISING